jgi:hypothetical protein
MPRPLRNACEGLRRDGQPVPPRPGGARAKPRILILGTPDDSRRIIIALRRAGHCPLWKRVDTGGSLTAALSDTSWSWNIVICNAALPSCHFMSAWPIVEALAPRATFVALWDGVGPRPAVGPQQGRLIVGRDVDDLPEFVSRIMAARRQRADSDRRPLRADVHRPHYHH